MTNQHSTDQFQQTYLDALTKLQSYGIDDPSITAIDFPAITALAVSAEETAQRTLVLLAISFTAYNFQECDKVVEWLKKEDIWKAASPAEKEFFRSPDPTEEHKASLSWRFEAAYQLAWCLNDVQTPVEPTRECNEAHAHDFFTHVPSVGTPVNDFCSAARFSNEYEIIGERIFYEKINAYLADIAVNRKENTSGIQARASQERLTALRWLTGFEGKKNWDEFFEEE